MSSQPSSIPLFERENYGFWCIKMKTLILDVSRCLGFGWKWFWWTWKCDYTNSDWKRLVERVEINGCKSSLIYSTRCW